MDGRRGRPEGPKEERWEWMVGEDGPKGRKRKGGNGWLMRTARKAEGGKPSPAHAGLGKDRRAGRPERPKEIKWDNLFPIS